MRRSFGGGSRGMGGGGTGGGGGGGGLQMLRTVQRANRAGAGGATQEPFPHTNSNSTTMSSGSRRARQSSYSKPSTPTNKLTLSSSTSSPFAPLNFPISAASTAPAWPSCSSPTYTDESEWECIDGSEDDRAHALLDDFVFGSVPSVDEVQHAVYSLQEFIEPVPSPYFMKDRPAYIFDKDTADKGSSPTGFLHRTSSYGFKLDWIEPSLHRCNSGALQPYGPERVYDAFHLLQNEPSVQRMVISLSSDRAVWDAVLNNEVVREIRDSLNKDDNSSTVGSDEISVASDAGSDILSWIVANVKAKIMELIHNITKAVNELFYHQESDMAAERNAGALEENLRASFMLSIVVLLIVVLNRANKA